MGRLIGGGSAPLGRSAPDASLTEKPIVIDSELLADFGHQLRNQLNAVVGAAGLLLTGAGTSEARELAAIIQVGAEQVADDENVEILIDACTGVLNQVPAKHVQAFAQEH